MKNKSIFFTILILGFLLILPQSVLAETITLDSGSLHSKTYELRKGDTISWDWKVPGEGYVDFWIADSEGNKYNEIQTQDESSGSFEVPESGTWNVFIKNNGFNKVTIDFEVSVNEGRYFPFLLIILPIIIVIVVLMILLMTKKKMEQLPPKENS